MATQEGLDGAGRRILMHMSVDVIEGGVLWAFHVIISVSAIVSGRAPPFSASPSSGSSNILLVVLITLLLMSTTFFCISVTQVVNAIRYGLIETPKESLFDVDQWRHVVNLNNKLQLPVSWLNAPGGIMYLIGDAVVVWRAFIICPGRRISLALAAFLMICSFGVSIASNILHVLFITKPGAPNYADILWAHLSTAALALSLAANGLATGSVGYEAYQHRKLNRELIGTTHSGAIQVLAYLTEAGAIYFILQVGHGILYLMAGSYFSPVDYLYRIWACFTLYYSITTPSIIILLILYNKSFTDGVRTQAQLSTRISFVHPVNTLGGGIDDENDLNPGPEPKF